METVGEIKLYSPEIVQTMIESIMVIRENLKISRNRQKSYADNHPRVLEFDAGDKVFLKLSSWKGVIRFERNVKLSPQ